MDVCVERVTTQPIKGQKTGTSGLRKRVKEFQSPHYLCNWIQVGVVGVVVWWVG
jgi:phosphoglucomutase